MRILPTYWLGFCIFFRYFVYLCIFDIIDSEKKILIIYTISDLQKIILNIQNNLTIFNIKIICNSSHFRNKEFYHPNIKYNIINHYFN